MAGTWGPKDARPTRSKVLTNLTELDLTDQHLGGDGMRQLARWPNLAKLRCLALGGKLRPGPQ